MNIVRVLIGVSLVLLSGVLSESGGILNRCRGGFANLSSISYWPRHDISRELFSLFTGLLVFVVGGLHLRAGFLVWLLTQWSLFIGWGSYMNVGSSETDTNSRSGIFDWLLGRQEEHWDYTQRVLREYSGMSLRGLIWTAPQGYALQQLGFGWQYSLSGSLMGPVYFIGSRTGIGDDDGNSTHHGENDFFDSTTAYSEYVWGTLVWFFLIVSCLTQLVHSVRIWVYTRSNPLTPNNPVNPLSRYNVRLYSSLNVFPCEVVYNIVFAVLWTLFASSVIFYSLINQSDIRNKAQTFFGLTVSTLFLTFFIGWRWGSCYHGLKQRRENNNNTDASNLVQVTPVTRRQQQHLYRAANDVERGGGGGEQETDPLLPWPYSHPDKAYANRRSPVPCDSLPLSSTNSTYSPVLFSSRTAVNNRQRLRRRSGRYSRFSVSCIMAWAFLEKWVWLDFFAISRHLIGFVSLAATAVALVTTSIAFVWDIESPRFRTNITCYD